MLQQELGPLIDQAEAQIEAAFRVVARGGVADLDDLLPRVDRICTLATEWRAVAETARLAKLIQRLDELGREVRDRMATSTSEEPE